MFSFVKTIFKILILVVLLTTIGVAAMFYPDLKRWGEGCYLSYKGDLAYKNGDYKQAEAYYSQAIKGYPFEAALLQKLGDTQLQMNQLQSAIRFYKRALELEPHSSHALTKLAKARWEQGEHRVALELYSDALRFSPNDGKLRETVGELYLSVARQSKNPKDYEHATALIEKTAKRSDSAQNESMRYRLAESLYAQGEYEKALSAYCDLAKKHPSNPETLYSLALAFAKNDAYKEAHRYMTQAAELTGSNHPELALKRAKLAFGFRQTLMSQAPRAPRGSVADCNSKLVVLKEQGKMSSK